MSTTVMALCWPLQIPPTQKAVLISLADNANDQGYCWPSITKICERTCFGKTAVIEAVKWLENFGFLDADRTSGRHTTYTITIPCNPSVSRTSPADVPVRQADATGPAGGPHPSVSRTTPVRQADTNRKEPSRTVSKSNRQDAAFDFSSWPADPSPKLLADWLSVRKKKRADVSDTVIDAMGKQLHLALALGWSVDDCLTECVLRNWQALKAEWLEPRNNHANSTSGRKLSAVDQVAAAIRERREHESDCGDEALIRLGHG